ncbi:MAG: HAD-IIA family hydrolase [Victivallales bacterium]
MLDIDDKTRLFAFDLDGTLYLGEKAMPGAVELIDYLRETYRIAFFTNNSSKTGKEVQGKLQRLGFKCNLDEVYTSSSATIKYLIKENLDNVYLIGSESFRSELTEKGLRTAYDDSADNLVVGFDYDFNYKKISIALSILLRGGRFIACNEDSFFPVGQNKYMPGCGAMVGAITASANKRPDFIAGKPNTYMLSMISKAYNVGHDEIIVVGDSYDSDITMALNFNCKAILISDNFNAPHRGNLNSVNNIKEILHHIKERK